MQVIQGENEVENYGYSHFVGFSAGGLLHADFLYNLLFDSENGSDMVLRNSGSVSPDNTELNTKDRTLHSCLVHGTRFYRLLNSTLVESVCVWAVSLLPENRLLPRDIITARF